MLSIEVDNPRLVTITGPGGIGKTRLGLEVGRALVAEFKDGVWLVELAAIAEAPLVGPAIAKVLGVPERNNKALLSNLSEYLSQKHLLLILDNCEHLLSEVALMAQTLLKSCPTLKIVATSREALNIAGEQRWPTASLSTPNEPKSSLTAQSVAGFEAVRLFCERASAVQPHFHLTDQNALAITQICQRLDGIPLALELAAARVGSLGVEQIAERLDKRFLLLTAGHRTALPRQKTLKATLDWSYDLLSPTQKQLFARLAVFVGGWSLKAAEEICATEELATESVLDELAQLVNKSLVVTKTSSSPFHYRMLETIREYSHEKLMELGSEAIKELRTNHLWYYLKLAEQVKPGYRTGYKASPDQLQSEFGNWQAALRWSLQAKELVEPGLRLGVALDYYWERNGYIYISEGQALLNQLQKSAKEAGLEHSPDYAWLLVALAGLADMIGDFKERLRLLEESLALFRKLEDKFGIATVLNDLSNQAILVGNFSLASRYIRESAALFRELDNKIGLAATLGNATLNAYFQKDFEGASRHLAENLALNRQTGNKRGFALGFLVKGLVAYSLGQYQEADRVLQEDLGLLDELGDKFAISLNLWAKGRIADKQDRYSEAIAYFQESLNLSYKLGYMLSVAYILGGMIVLLCQINDLAEGPGQFELAPNPNYREGYAWAARLGGALTTLMAQLGMVMDPLLKEDFEAATEEIQTKSGKKAFEGWFEEGRFMPLEEVINSVLAIKLENNANSGMKGA